MSKPSEENWKFYRRIDVSVIIQIVLLAGLIISSWVNLQSQLDVLQRDVNQLLQCNREFKQKLETLSGKNIVIEYRLKTLELAE